jgi:hypothetical protein
MAGLKKVIEIKLNIIKVKWTYYLVRSIRVMELYNNGVV